MKVTQLIHRAIAVCPLHTITMWPQNAAFNSLNATSCSYAADNTANKVSLKYASAQQLERSIFIVRSRHRIGNFEQNMPRTNNTPLHWTAG